MYVNKPRGIRKRQHGKEQRLRQTEDCCIRADANRQRNNGDKSKSGTFQQHPRRISYVLPQRVHNNFLCAQLSTKSKPESLLSRFHNFP